MNIQRHHTYAAYLLSDVMINAGEPAPDIEQLQADYPATVAALQQRQATTSTDLAARIAQLLPSLQRAADWPGA